MALTPDSCCGSSGFCMLASPCVLACATCRLSAPPFPLSLTPFVPMFCPRARTAAAIQTSGFVHYSSFVLRACGVGKGGLKRRSPRPPFLPPFPQEARWSLKQWLELGGSLADFARGGGLQTRGQVGACISHSEEGEEPRTCPGTLLGLWWREELLSGAGGRCMGFAYSLF